MSSRTATKLKTPFRDLLPPLSSEEFDALRASIRNGWLGGPIFVDEDGNILDGHHRYRIRPDCPQKVIRGLSEEEKAAFVIKANVARRNLSPDQKRSIRQKQIELARSLKQQGHTQQQIAGILGVPRATITKWLRTNVQMNKGSHSLPDARVKLSGTAREEIKKRVKSGESRRKVAADYGVTETAIRKTVSRETRKDGTRTPTVREEALGKPVVRWSKGIVQISELLRDLDDVRCARLVKTWNDREITYFLERVKTLNERTRRWLSIIQKEKRRRSKQ